MYSEDRVKWSQLVHGVWCGQVSERVSE